MGIGRRSGEPKRSGEGKKEGKKKPYEGQAESGQERLDAKQGNGTVVMYSVESAVNGPALGPKSDVIGC